MKITAGPSKIYTSVIAATYALTVKGTIMGLSEQRTPLQSKADKPEVIQAIAPAGDDGLYTSEKASVIATDGTRDLSWVLFPKSNVTNLAFRFEHHYETFQAVSSNADPLGSLPPHKAETIHGLFGIDLANIRYSSGRSIQLIYEPDSKDGIGKIGNLYLLVGSRKVPLSWQTTTAANDNLESPLSSKWRSHYSLWAVYAASLGGKPRLANMANTRRNLEEC